MKKGGSETEPQITRRVLTETEIVVYDPNYRDTSTQYARAHSGWVTLKMQVVKVEGQPRTHIVPGMAGDIVTTIPIKKKH